MNENERIFPILRKLDFLWSKSPGKNLCDIIKELNGGEFRYMTDQELEQKLKTISPEDK